MMAIFSALAGRLADKIRPMPLLLLGGFGTCFAIFMASLCNRLYEFILSQGALLGASNAFLLCPPMAIVSRLFDKHRGAAIGTAVTGASIGGIVWPLMLDQLLNKNGVSLGWALRTVGFTMLSLCIFIILVTRMPQGMRDDTHDTIQAPGQEKNAPNQGPEANEIAQGNVKITKNPTFYVLCIGFSIACFGIYTPSNFVSTYAVDRGLSASLSFYLVSILNGASFVGRLTTGLLVDRFGNFNLLFMNTVLSGIISMCWTKATTLAGIIIFTLAYGFSSGSFYGCQIPCAVQLAPPGSQGAALGLILAAPAISSLVGPPISGYLVKHGYLDVSMYAGATLLAGALLILYARFRQAREVFAKV
ncbi:hypothetical protein AWENTII_010401 [Aspergillus wentii]